VDWPKVAPAGRQPDPDQSMSTPTSRHRRFNRRQPGLAAKYMITSIPAMKASRRVRSSTVIAASLPEADLAAYLA
jgi:hypothetical protein